jgi:uncharacterized protein YcbK (DUF882 family)
LTSSSWRSHMLDWKKYPNFSREEFTCRCGCQKNEMDPQFLELIQILRENVSTPLIINSGFRCNAHNNAVSKTGFYGPHTTGRACDIKTCYHNAYYLIMAATRLPFTGIGIKQSGSVPNRFIHLDILDGPNRPRIWSY